MSMSAITAMSSQGLLAQGSMLAAHADNIANLATSGYVPQTVSTASLPGGGVRTDTRSSGANGIDETGEMTGMIESAEAFEANASVFETGADLWDVLMSIKRD